MSCLEHQDLNEFDKIHWVSYLMIMIILFKPIFLKYFLLPVLKSETNVNKTLRTDFHFHHRCVTAGMLLNQSESSTQRQTKNIINLFLFLTSGRF
jgi:hypothetical protein